MQSNAARDLDLDGIKWASISVGMLSIVTLEMVESHERFNDSPTTSAWEGGRRGKHPMGYVRSLVYPTGTNMETLTSASPEALSHGLDDDAFNVEFTGARTHTVWLDRPIGDDLLHQLYELMKWGPTSANCCPARILFLRSPEAKERLRGALMPANVEKTMTAPVTAIIAYDSKFYETLPRLYPAMPSMKDMYEKSPELAESTAFRNGTLQGAYFILAARSLGLDCGPMSGFDNAKVDKEFFPVASGNAVAGEGKFITAGYVKSNFLCNLGHGNAATLRPRGPRLAFGEACQLL